VDQADLNQLQTALNAAIAAEDWQAAAKLRDQLRQVVGSEGQTAADWKALGVLDWLADRAESLGFSFPTGESQEALYCGILLQAQQACCEQISFAHAASCRSRHPIAVLPFHSNRLLSPSSITHPSRHLFVCAEVQKRAAPVIIDGGDCVINSVTGSGKTLSFLLPLLSRLSYPPATYPDDLKAGSAAAVPP
jgi:hypothetical protein